MLAEGLLKSSQRREYPRRINLRLDECRRVKEMLNKVGMRRNVQMPMHFGGHETSKPGTEGEFAN